MRSKVAAGAAWLLVGLALTSCAPEGPDGTIAFNLEGSRYEIHHAEFRIEASVADSLGFTTHAYGHNRLTAIPPGAKAQFFCSLGSANVLNRLRLVPRVGDVTLDESFMVAWQLSPGLRDPEAFLRSRRISGQDRPPILLNISINVPGIAIGSMLSAPTEYCWLQLEEFLPGNRVRGRFGARLKAIRQATGTEKTVEITNGSFDVPYRKLFAYTG